MSIRLQWTKMSANGQEFPRQWLGVVSRVGDVRQQSFELRVYHEKIGRIVTVQRPDRPSRSRRNNGFR